MEKELFSINKGKMASFGMRTEFGRHNDAFPVQIEALLLKDALRAVIVWAGGTLGGLWDEQRKFAEFIIKFRNRGDTNG